MADAVQELLFDESIPCGSRVGLLMQDFQTMPQRFVERACQVLFLCEHRSDGVPGQMVDLAIRPRGCVANKIGTCTLFGFTWTTRSSVAEENFDAETSRIMAVPP